MSTNSTIGPYELLAPLSAGAMGALARARDRETGEIVALKFVERAVRLNIRSLRREIRALQALDHPNVVTIVAADPEAAPPWYAMELIDGLPLSRHWRVMAAPERWARYLSGFADICDGLAYMHGKGLVHRDLKPANVIIRAADSELPGEAVLVDFGLATAAGGGIGREQLYKRSEVIGTPSYISPEQVRQQYVDGRADLYALGCMLYELVVGEPPFPSKVPFTGMMHHVTLAPSIPEEIEQRLPPPLVELIYALLEKEPGNRPGYATDVRAVLAGLVELPARQRPPVRTHLHRAEFVGRDGLRPIMEETAESLAVGGEGGVVVVRGPAGSGKSRVTIELIQHVHARVGDHGTVLVANGVKQAAHAPLSALRGVFEELADECLEKGVGFTRDLLGGSGGFIGRHLPVIGNLPGVDAPLIDDPLRLESATIDAITSVLLTQASRGPFVVAIDDVQWADGLTRRWLESLLVQRPWDPPLLLVLVWRDDEGDRLLDSFDALSSVRRIDVRRLERTDVMRLMGSMTGVSDPPPAFAEAVWTSSSGMPSRVVQWLDTCVAHGVLRRDDGEWRFEGKPLDEVEVGGTVVMDASFEELLRRRVSGLPAAERALVDFMAVLGASVRAEVVEQLSSPEARTLERLVAEGLFVDSGRGDIRFATPELYDAVAGPLRENPRRTLHVRAAAVLEAVDATAIEIAAHLAASGWKDEARKRLWDAAQARITLGDFSAAEDLLEQLVELGFRSATEEIQGRAARAKLLGRRGQPDAEREELRLASALVGSVDDVETLGALAFARAKMFQREGELDSAVSAFRMAGSNFREAGIWPRERDALIEVGNSYCRRGEFARGRELFTSVYDEARARGDQEGVATALASVGTTLVSSRMYDAASDFLGRAASSFGALGLRARRASVLQNLGVCEGDRGDYVRASAAFREVLELWHEMGDLRSMAAAQAMLGHVLLRSGDISGAIEQLEASLPMLRRTGDQIITACAEGYLGEAHAARGEFEAAMDHFVEALHLHRKMEFSSLEPYVYVEIAKLHRRLGLYADAQHYLEKARCIDDDRFLDVFRRVQLGHLELAANQQTDVSADELEAELREMQLPEASDLAQAVQSFRAAASQPPHSLRRGELVEALPAVFRET